MLRVAPITPNIMVPVIAISLSIFSVNSYNIHAIPPTSTNEHATKDAHTLSSETSQEKNNHQNKI